MRTRQLAWMPWCAAVLIAACGSNGGDSMDGNTPKSSDSGNQKTDSTSMAGTSGGSAGMGDGAGDAAGTGSDSSTGGAAAMDAAAGAGGAGAGAGAAGSDAPAAGTGGTDMMAADEDPRGKCNIDSGFPDDEACLLPPDPSEGMQIHVGPTDYNDPDQINKFIFHAGDEASECWTFHTPNDQDVYYQTFELSGRTGTHHIINTMYNIDVQDGGFTTCLDPGTGTNGNIIDNLPGASRAYMPRTKVAPENAGLGRMIPAHVTAQADMHYFNYTDKDILREFWMNIYFIPKDKVTQQANQIRGMGGISWTFAPIAPGTDMVYQYSCPIDKDGRITELLGHYHSHGQRFTAYLTHADGMREKVFEMYDYLDPKIFQYDSITTNPSFSDTAAGAFTGILNVKAGDSLDWECHVVNDSSVGLTYTNNVTSGEMCNLWGSAVGPSLNCVLP